MKATLDLPRNDDGALISYAWPGGYPVYYLDKQSNVLCPSCANRDICGAQPVIAADINWEDTSLYCDDCGKRIESAYADDDTGDTATEEK